MSEWLEGINGIDSLKQLLEYAEGGKKPDWADESYNVHGWNSPAIIATCWKLAEFYADSSDAQSSIRYQRIGFDEAARVGDTLSFINACNILGVGYRRLSDFQNSAKYHSIGIHAGEIFSDSLNPAVLNANILNISGLGKIYLTVGYLEDAKREFLRGLSLSDSTMFENKALNSANLGIIYMKQNNYDSARMYIYESYKYDILSGDSEGLALASIHLGSLCRMKGHMEEALNYYQESMDYFKAKGDDWHWLEGASAKAEYLMAEGKYKRAYPLIEEILEKAEKISSDKYQNIAHLYLANYYKNSGNFKKAMEHSELRAQYYEKIKSAQQLGGIKDITSDYEKRLQQSKLEDLNYKNSQLKIQRNEIVIILLCVIIIVAVAWGIYVSHVLRRLGRLNSIVKESEEIKSSFINSMCHEIRTPLNQISGYSQLLTSSSEVVPADERKQYGEIIVQNTEALIEMLDQILEISALDSSEQKFPLSNINVVDCVRNVFDRHTQKNHNEKVEFIYNGPSDGEYVLSNSKYLSIQLDTILDNALKFTPEGTITVSIKKEKRHMLISVADTGIGIPAELKERVFEKFYKVNSFEKGTGLGLYLAKLIETRLHNKVYVNSDYTGGTEMIIEF